MQREAIVVAFAAILGTCVADPAQANWLTTLVREGGELGVKGATHLPQSVRLSPIGKAAAHLSTVKSAPHAALAAHATPAGHWQFANREGQLFTAASPEEMKRLLPSLQPDAVAAGEKRISLFVSEDSFFSGREHLKALPENADLTLVTDEGLAFPISRVAATKQLTALLRPNLMMRLAVPELFQEAVAFLARPINRANIRPLAVTSSGPKFVPPAPRLDPVTKLAEFEAIDPAHIEHALRALSGQTVILTGNVEAGSITFGGSGSKLLASLVDTARNSDVNLIILNTPSGAQPGGRTWLWRTTTIDGLANASSKATMGDFLASLAEVNGAATLDISRDGVGRIRVAIRSDRSEGVADRTKTAISDVVGNVTGQVMQKGAELYTRDNDAQREQDARLLPFLPSSVQIIYIAGMVLGLLGLQTVRAWWSRLTPSHGKAAHVRNLIHVVQRIPHEALFILLFLPLTGPFAFLWQTLTQLLAMIVAPFTWLHRKLAQRAA